MISVWYVAFDWSFQFPVYSSEYFFVHADPAIRMEQADSENLVAIEDEETP